jgi:hypothetical protein
MECCETLCSLCHELLPSGLPTHPTAQPGTDPPLHRSAPSRQRSSTDGSPPHQGGRLPTVYGSTRAPTATITRDRSTKRRHAFPRAAHQIPDKTHTSPRWSQCLTSLPRFWPHSLHGLLSTAPCLPKYDSVITLSNAPIPQNPMR